MQLPTYKLFIAGFPDSVSPTTLQPSSSIRPKSSFFSKEIAEANSSYRAADACLANGRRTTNIGLFAVLPVFELRA